MHLWLLLLLFPLSGCLGSPQGIQPVQNFELTRYLGTWYEIARLDHPFERGLQHVTAEYSMRNDGGVTVVNRGFSVKGSELKEAVGRAYFVRGENEGYLKVSFFGPFYGSYVIFELDRDEYQYSFVTSSSRSYLWLLARTPTVNEEIFEKFLTTTKELGFDTRDLIIVEHN